MPKICKKCGDTFPFLVEIGGKIRNLSARHFCLSCSPFGINNRMDMRKINGDSIRCSTCQEFKPKGGFYRRTDDRNHGYQSECKSCTNKRTIERHRRLKLQALEYRGGKCIKCGYDKHPAALDFHHRNKNDKEFTISQYRNYNLEDIKDELDKCDILCSNCHRILHYEETAT